MKKISPDIQVAVSALMEGAPLSTTIAKLDDILSKQVIASYRDGLSLRACGKLHSITWGQVVTILKRDAPHLIRTHLQRFQKGHPRFNQPREAEERTE